MDQMVSHGFFSFLFVQSHHRVPSTSKTIPFNEGASVRLAGSGSSGANLRWRSADPSSEDIVRNRDLRKGRGPDIRIDFYGADADASRATVGGLRVRLRYSERWEDGAGNAHKRLVIIHY